MITKHVTSLELSKDLYEAGIVVESEFWWQEDRLQTVKGLKSSQLGGDPAYELVRCVDKIPGASKTPRFIYYPAPLSSELGELLPMEVNIPFKSGKRRAISNSLHIYHTNTGWHINYIAHGVDERPSVSGDTEANARAKCLLYLKEKGLL